MTSIHEPARLGEGAGLTDAEHAQAIYDALAALNKAMEIATYAGGLRVEASIGEDYPVIGSSPVRWRSNPRVRVALSRPIDLSGSAP